MCKACRQRSIWARIKLLSSISVADFHQRRTHSELKKKMFSSLLQTWVPSFQSFLEAKLLESSSHQPDTHAYRFVDQFLKNSSLPFRADEFENYKTQIRLVKPFRKYFLFSFSLDRFALSLEAGCGILLADFSTVKTLVEKIFITTRSGLSLPFEQRVAYFNPLFLSVKPNSQNIFPPPLSRSSILPQFIQLRGPKPPKLSLLTMKQLL